ncbi:MAG: hypothetical protein VW405_02595 [Rhodospirillaceae bacterium]
MNRTTNAGPNPPPLIPGTDLECEFWTGMDVNAWILDTFELHYRTPLLREGGRCVPEVYVRGEPDPISPSEEGYDRVLKVLEDNYDGGDSGETL